MLLLSLQTQDCIYITLIHLQQCHQLPELSCEAHLYFKHSRFCSIIAPLFTFEVERPVFLLRILSANIFIPWQRETALGCRGMTHHLHRTASASIGLVKENASLFSCQSFLHLCLHPVTSCFISSFWPITSFSLWPVLPRHRTGSYFTYYGRLTSSIGCALTACVSGTKSLEIVALTSVVSNCWFASISYLHILKSIVLQGPSSSMARTVLNVQVCRGKKFAMNSHDALKYKQKGQAPPARSLQYNIQQRE